MREWIPSGERVLRFLFHVVVYVPVILTVLVAWAFQVPSDQLRLFSTFAVTAISLEICWGCIVESAGHILQLGAIARQASRGSEPHPRLVDIVALLNRTKTHTAVYALLTIMSLMGWVTVACCEIQHMAHDDQLPRPALAVAAAWCAAFNGMLSLCKLWSRTNQEIPRLIQELLDDAWRLRDKDGEEV